MHSKARIALSNVLSRHVLRFSTQQMFLKTLRQINIIFISDSEDRKLYVQVDPKETLEGSKGHSALLKGGTTNTGLRDPITYSL